MIRLIAVGVAGVGRWGRNHVRALRELEKEGKVVLRAICDVSETALREVASTFSIEIASRDCGDIVKHVDAVVVATSISSLYSVARLFIEEGKHVLVEKPAAESAAKAAELYRLAQGKGVIVVPGMIMRFHPVVEELRRLLRRRGDGFYCLAMRWASRRPEGARSYPLWLDVGVHCVDLCRHLSSSEVVEVVAAHAERVASDELSVALLKTESGPLCWTYLDGVSAHKVRELEVYGFGFYARAEVVAGSLTVHSEAGPMNVGVSWEEPLKRELRSFLLSVERGEYCSVPSLEDAVKNLEVVEAIIEMSGEGAAAPHQGGCGATPARSTKSRRKGT